MPAAGGAASPGLTTTVSGDGALLPDGAATGASGAGGSLCTRRAPAASRLRSTAAISVSFSTASDHAEKRPWYCSPLAPDVAARTAP